MAKYRFDLYGSAAIVRRPDGVWQARLPWLGVAAEGATEDEAWEALAGSLHHWMLASDLLADRFHRYVRAHGRPVRRRDTLARAPAQVLRKLSMMRSRASMHAGL